MRKVTTNLIAAIPYESLGARMTCDATSFADEVLILGLIVRVDDVGNTVGRSLQRFTAETVMAFVDYAVDAAVATGSGDRAQHHGLGCKERIKALVE